MLFRSEETYKRPFLDRLFRNILSFVLPRPKAFLLMAWSSKILKPFSFLFPKFIRNALNLMPDKIPGKKLKEKTIPLKNLSTNYLIILLWMTLTHVKVVYL